ncbi:glycoside hydrolase family 3 C-terminal domain-containing protein [Amycolatopsis saalfeldensis]|uniref:Beta-glucosidase n=1 Tax=Amycolatopsis saalfeldensis TaxID=394193 RepID=A0A1H8XTW7_9PSEU|nr:glycoside hydrolase family 3 C-terminal domain-containing protein [Amycolatopsis saalfeldensis]SEP43474.1 beta-glucosidase [Amycolatopsis saalfeldensis]
MAHTRPARRSMAFAVVALSGITLAVAVMNGSAAAAPPPPVYRDTQHSFAERAADLVSRMTLPEKVQQLHTNNAPAITRLGVQQYTYWSEGQHGLNRLGADAGAGGQGDVDNVHSTSFPVNFAAAMSWDPALTYSETTAISDEARGFLDKSLFGTGQNNIGPDVNDYGDLTYWAPTVNLDRDPRWGRTDEAFGEDPYLVAQMAGAFVNGYQGNKPDGSPMTPYLKVAATVKHYALNNVEDNRLSGDSVTTEADLHQYYLKQFQKLVQDDHAAGLMTSYNAINGTPGAVDTYLVNQLAQRTFGFDGYTTSDCDAIQTAWEPPPGGHLWAAPGWKSSVSGAQVIWTNTATGATIPAAAGAEAYGLRAGTQLNCTGDQATLTNIQAAIGAGILSEGVLDADLVRLFTMRMATGEFDPPAQVGYTKIDKSVIESPAHQDLATKVADNSLVLLKNAAMPGGGPVLPADPAKTAKVVVLGDLANTVTLGGYSGQPTHTVNPVEGIKAALPNASVVFDAAGTSTTATTPAVLSDATKSAVRAADLVLIFAGTDHSSASEGHDRANLGMPGNYGSLIDQVTALGNPRTALALQTVGPVALGDLQAKVPAILFSGYNGQSQGTALADVLFGKQNPDGHLDFTWYSGDAQLPPMQDYGLNAASTGGLGRTYQYFTGAPTYPFGYGLGYSTFRLSNVTADRRSVAPDGTVNVGLDVTNTGPRKGTTVAQLYVASPGAGTGDVPLQRLAGFRKTQPLDPGQTQHVVLPVKVSDLALWDTAHSREAVAPGTYQFRVGSDASTIVARSDVQVTGAAKPKVRTVTVQPESVVYHPGQTFDLAGRNRWLADDTNPAEEPDRDLGIAADKVVEAVNDDQSFVDTSHAAVGYRSSNPAVASVDRNGSVRAIKDGVATITATVNGVSGSAPIVVQGTLTSTVPSILAAAGSGPASATFTNGDTKDVRDLAVSITAPPGWTATPAGPTTYARVPAGGSVTVKWTLSAGADVKPGSYPIGFTAKSSAGSFGSSGGVKVPYPSVEAAYDNTGISNDNAPAAGAFDGSGLNYSAQALAAAGFPPGQTVTAGGIGFTWPRPNVPDNIVAGGQVLPVSGRGALLGFLGSSAFGSTSAPGTIVYSDGSTQGYTLSFADWWAGGASPGTSIAATTPYLNSGPNSARQNQNVHVYLAWAALDPAKTVQYVILPDTASGQAPNAPAAHVFAVGIGPAAQSATVGAAFGNPDSTHGLVVQNGGDGSTTATTAGGLPARTTAAGSSYLYLDLDDGVVPGGGYQATAYVSYFDHGTGGWNLHYDSFADVPNNAYRDSAWVTDTNTDTWKTAVIPLPDAAFSNRENNHADLRLNIGTGEQSIGRVAVTVGGGNVVPISLATAQPDAPVVTQQPQDASAAPATFTAYALGDPAPLVRWQAMAAGGPWADVPDATGTTLTVAQPVEGTQYRAVFTNLAGATTSDAATVHVP